jgi:CRP-like cAMP-binding protein
MHESLIKYINSFTTTPLTAIEIKLIKNTFVPKKITKRQYFLREGEVCKYFAFIVKGAMRQYSVDGKGVEHIVQLLIENWWAGDRESFIMLTPSKYNVDAWENSEALIFTRADLLNLWSLSPSIGEWIRKLDERHSIANQRRLNASISLSTEERYSDFVDNYPDFFQRFPLHMIASYLGVTKETLSRIRRQLVTK